MEMSFGMIFTIILVIVFIVFAFYAIKGFLNLQKKIQAEQFFENFQKETDKMYQSTYGSKNVSFNFPSNVEKVCFQNTQEDNVFLDLNKGYEQKTINHLNNDKILNGKNESCATVTKNKVEFIFSKEYGEDLVTIKF